MADRPADIISPTTDQVLPTKVPPADAREAGRFGYAKPTPDNSVMLFIDRHAHPVDAQRRAVAP